MRHLAQYVRPGGGQRHADPGERRHHLRGRVRVDRAAERVGEIGREPPQHLGPGARRGARAQQRRQQLVVDARAPRQPVEAHLHGGQRTRRLRRAQQPHRLRALDPGGPAQLVRVHLDDGRQMVRPGRQAVPVGGEQRGLAVRGALARVVGDGQAAQPGPGGAQRPGMTVAAFVAEQQRLGELQVVAAAEPHRHAVQQARVEVVGGRPDPAGAAARFEIGDRAGEVGDRFHRPGGRPVVGDRPQPAARAHLVGGHGEAVGGCGHRPSLSERPYECRECGGRVRVKRRGE